MEARTCDAALLLPPIHYPQPHRNEIALRPVRATCHGGRVGWRRPRCMHDTPSLRIPIVWLVPARGCRSMEIVPWRSPSSLASHPMKEEGGLGHVGGMTGPSCGATFAPYPSGLRARLVSDTHSTGRRRAAVQLPRLHAAGTCDARCRPTAGRFGADQVGEELASPPRCERHSVQPVMVLCYNHYNWAHPRATPALTGGLARPELILCHGLRF